jgi:hypothetical protein
VNLCVTHSRTMHPPITYEMHGFQIVQHILNSLRMAIIVIYLMFNSCVSIIHDFSSVTLLFSGTLILDV